MASALAAAAIPALLAAVSALVSLFVPPASLGLLVFGSAVPVVAVLGPPEGVSPSGRGQLICRRCSWPH